MTTGGNPIISVVENIGMFESEETATGLYDQNFTIAFGVRNYLKNEFKADPNYVKWEARIFEGDGEN